MCALALAFSGLPKAGPLEGGVGPHYFEIDIAQFPFTEKSVITCRLSVVTMLWQPRSIHMYIFPFELGSDSLYEGLPHCEYRLSTFLPSNVYLTLLTICGSVDGDVAHPEAMKAIEQVNCRR